jgi:cellulose synthase/poly-beta-1,6-N-acetylglucosamine synthase-like glycosyltransferase
MIIFPLFGLYLVLSLVIFFLTFKADGSPAGVRFPFVSVVIAARNEEKDIGACLDSLRGQSFPPQGFEVIVIDDHSTDATPVLVRSYLERQDNFRLFELGEGLSGKKAAMTFGIKQARGEYIFQIDADCRAPQKWLSELCAHLGKDNVLVGGFTLIRYQKKLLERIQALEHHYMLSVGKAVSRSMRTLSLFGNNTAFKKEAYEQAGGYESLSKDISIDYQLVRAFHERAIGRAELVFNADSAVSTEPMKGLKDYFHQKKRWALGILNMFPGWKLVLLPTMLLYLGASLYPFFTRYFLLIFLLRLAADLGVMLNSLRRFRQCGLIPYLFFFQINLTLMVAGLGCVLLLSPKIRWKGR